MLKVKDYLSVICGTVSGMVISYLGGWDEALETLVIFMTIDFITGLYIAGCLNKSPKTENGALSSKMGFRGLCKKFLVLIIIGCMHRIDMLLGLDYLRYVAIISYMVIELISIIENAGVMGVPIPEVVKKAIDLLNDKTEV